MLQVTVGDDLGPGAVAALRRAGADPVVDRRRHTVSAAVDAPRDVARLMRALEEADVAVTDLDLVQPTLDDAYLALIAQHASTDPARAAR
jgi:ABC-2 type transport system ATP-binding protein